MLEDSAIDDFAGLNCNHGNPNAVVVGLAPSKFDYEHMNTAFRYAGIVYKATLFLHYNLASSPGSPFRLHVIIASDDL